MQKRSDSKNNTKTSKAEEDEEDEEDTYTMVATKLKRK